MVPGHYDQAVCGWIGIEPCELNHVQCERAGQGSFYMKRVRVLVANRPRLMRELVLATIADQPDIEVVGEVFEESRLTEVVEEVQPDALIVTLDDAEKHSALCGFLLGRHPKMRILALAPERNQGMYYWAVVNIRSKQM